MASKPPQLTRDRRPSHTFGRHVGIASCTLATLLLSSVSGLRDGRAQDLPTDPNGTTSHEEGPDTTDADERSDMAPTVRQGEEDEDVDDGAQERVVPVRVPGIFFDNSLNPTDYLGRELNVEEDAPDLLASIQTQRDILRETHDADQIIRRTFTLNTHRETKLQHRGRRHNLDDELRQRLDVSFRYQQDPEDADRIDVTVHHAEPSASQPGAPLDVRVPSAGLELHCWQRDFQVRCQRAKDARDVAWPQWATLDMSDWFSRRPVRAGTRWRRSFSHAETAGWTDGRTGRIQASLELSESGPEAGEENSYIRGALSGDGDLNVYHRVETMPIDGQIDMEFDHRAGIVRHLTWQWDGEATTDGLLQGHRYHWTRETSSTLRVRSSAKTAAEDAEEDAP